MNNACPEAIHICNSHKPSLDQKLQKSMSCQRTGRLTENKAHGHNKLYMAGGGFSGLTRQTSCPLSCGSDRISLRNPARPHTSDRYGLVKETSCI